MRVFLVSLFLLPAVRAVAQPCDPAEADAVTPVLDAVRQANQAAASREQLAQVRQAAEQAQADYDAARAALSRVTPSEDQDAYDAALARYDEARVVWEGAQSRLREVADALYESEVRPHRDRAEQLDVRVERERGLWRNQFGDSMADVEAELERHHRENIDAPEWEEDTRLSLQRAYQASGLHDLEERAARERLQAALAAHDLAKAAGWVDDPYLRLERETADAQAEFNDGDTHDEERLRAYYRRLLEIHGERRLLSQARERIDSVNGALESAGSDLRLPYSADRGMIETARSYTAARHRAGRRTPGLEIPPHAYASLPVPDDRRTGFSLRMARYAAESGRGSLLRGRFESDINSTLFPALGVGAFRALDLDRTPSNIPYFWVRHDPDAPHTTPSDVAATPQRPGSFQPAGIADLHQAYLRGIVTPTQIAERFITAARRDPLNAFTHVGEAAIREQARASTRRYQAWLAGRGPEPGLLDGVIIPVKDQIDVEGVPTTLGTQFIDTPAERDASAIARLRTAGAVIAPKTNMHEVGMGVTGHNPWHGSALNAYRTSHLAGGSSAGSAGAVASGLAPVAIGHDAGGSIRIPAAFSGLVGLKPTFGRVADDGVPLTRSLAQMGPMAFDVETVAAVYLAMAGPNRRDYSSEYQPRAHLRAFENTDLTGMRVGVYRRWNQDADPQIRAATEQAIDRLEALGAEVVEIEIPWLREMYLAHLITVSKEITQSQLRHLRDGHGEEYSDEIRLNFQLNGMLTRDDELQAARIRTLGLQLFGQLFDDVDLIVTPTTARTAPEVPDAASGVADIGEVNRIATFTTQANLLGLPALTLPAGYDDDGLPIGVQLMGRWFDEDVILRAGHALQSRTSIRQPQAWTPLLTPEELRRSRQER